MLNVAAFTDPTAYQLNVKSPGSDESRLVNADLLETFNYLTRIHRSAGGVCGGGLGGCGLVCEVLGAGQRCQIGLWWGVPGSACFGCWLSGTGRCSGVPSSRRVQVMRMMVRSRVRELLNCSAHGQRLGRCSVVLRAERVIRPGVRR